MYKIFENTMCSGIKITRMTKVVHTNMPLYSKWIHPTDDCEKQHFYITVICSDKCKHLPF